MPDLFSYDFSTPAPTHAAQATTTTPSGFVIVLTLDMQARMEAVAQHMAANMAQARTLAAHNLRKLRHMARNGTPADRKRAQHLLSCYRVANVNPRRASALAADARRASAMVADLMARGRVQLEHMDTLAQLHAAACLKGLLAARAA